MTHIRYSNMTAAFDCKENRHAQQVMEELGITYTHSTPQSMGDQWWFWNCKNIPNPLPKYLSELTVDPMKCIGFGLSKDRAIEISDIAKETDGVEG